MPSNSLVRWRRDSAAALDEIESAHAAIGGARRGRRYATQQINYAYAALLSSYFQRFCRDLHSECVDHIVAAMPPQFRVFVRTEFSWNRRIDRGNPHPGALGEDFNRLGIEFWPAIYALDARNARRNQFLAELVNWRNAIAHQDFTPFGGNATLHLSRVQRWRRAVAALAEMFERAMYDHLTALAGNPPW